MPSASLSTIEVSSPHKGGRWIDDGEGEAPVRAWTAQEAQVFRDGAQMLSPWRVVAVQALIGSVACLLFVVLSAQASVVWSAAYGAAAVVLPNALLARGMSSAARSATGLAARFLVWEMLKIGAAIALMLIAAKTVPDLHWPVFLGVMVVCMKVNWFALLWRSGR
jgi:ATP synthase protein I